MSPPRSRPGGGRDTDDGPTLADVVGRNVRRIRDDRGWSQADLSRMAWDLGIAWTQSVVSAIERGARVLGLDDLILLSLVLDATPDALLAGGATVTVGESRIPLRLVRQVLANDRAQPGDRSLLRTSGSDSAPRHQRGDLPHVVGPDPAGDRHRDIRRDASQEAEKNAQRSLNLRLNGRPRLSAIDVTTCAYDLWGHSLTAERDRRVARIADPGADERTIQGLKGHTTRRLLDELHSHLTQESAP